MCDHANVLLLVSNWALVAVGAGLAIHRFFFRRPDAVFNTILQEIIDEQGAGHVHKILHSAYADIIAHKEKFILDDSNEDDDDQDDDEDDQDDDEDDQDDDENDQDDDENDQDDENDDENGSGSEVDNDAADNDAADDAGVLVNNEDQ